VSVVANVAINVDSSGAVSKLRQVQQGAQATSQAVDKLNATTAATSNKFKIAANGIKYFTDAAGRARAENGRFLTSTERAAAGIRNQGNAAQQASGQFNLLKNAFSGLAAAFGVGFALTKVIADVKELDTNLRRLGTVGGNVAALDKGLGALSDRLDGVANKAELAAASYQALSAGFTETGANLRVVEAATKAAVGGMVDVTAATEVTTKVLNAYNMSGDQATKVTDSIAKSIEYGVIQWSDYTSQLGRVASVSAIAGVSLDEVNAFISSATKNSATAEIAFTGLGATLSNMLKPTKESADAAKALGINWNLAGIRGEGFESLMGKLGIAMQKNPVLANQMVGGQEAVRGAFAAASKGGKDYAMILEGLGGAAGKTDADFQTMKGSLENTLKALDTSFKNLSEALGTAFGPTVVIAVQDITKAVNGFADFMAMVPQPVMNTVGTIVKLVAQILLVQKAIQGIIALKAGVAGMLAATAASATAAGTAAGGAATKVNMLKGAMLGLLRFGLVTLAIEIVVSGLGKLAEVQARMNAITKGSTKQFAEQVGGSATSRQEIENLKKENREERARRVEELKSVRFPLLTAQDDIARQAITQLDTRLAQLQTMGERARFATPVDRAKADATPTPTPTTGTGTGTGKGAGKGKDDAARIAEQIRASKLQLTLAQDIFAIEGRLQQAQLEGNEQLVLARNAQKELAQIASQRADIIADKEIPALAKKNVLDKLAIDAATVSGKLGFDLAKIEQDRTKSFDAIIADLNLELALKTATTEQERERLRIEAARAKLQADLKGQGFDQEKINTITGLQAQVDAPKTEGQKINAELGAVEDELKTLVSLSNQVTSAANAIGTAFGNSFKGLISGSMTAKEALASFFSSVADHFLDMAAQIIAKMIQMFILQQALKIFGGALGGGFGAGGAGFGGSNAFSSFDAGGAAAFGMPSLMAQGGFVTGPTSAIIGEGGESEYVIPASKMSAAMSRYGRGARGEGVIPASGGSEGSNTPSATGGPMAIDVRYTVERINSVEYVTADQFQAGMLLAAQQGASQGEQRALRQLQQNTSIRGRVGLR
jgi:TP901 family phage tail tape measure protein